MMLQLLGYVAAVVAGAIVAPVIGAVVFVITLPLVKPLRPLGRLSLCYNFAVSAGSMWLAIVLFIWLARRIDVTLAFVMFLLPWIGAMMNDYRRIDAAKEGRFLSGVGQSMARHVDDIDYRGVAWGEYGSLGGDTVGIWLPVLFLDNLALW